MTFVNSRIVKARGSSMRWPRTASSSTPCCSRSAELRAIDARAYLELHIEQGPVLESMRNSTGVVQGTFGVERHMLRFTGQAAHSGSTPIPMRRDAFLAAAQTALACREIGLRHSTPAAGVVCTVGVVNVEPKIVTAVPACMRDFARPAGPRS